MPDKPGTVAAYAAGASLAAVTLFYVFGPTFTIDGDDASTSGRKKGVVGLFNPANDCFINSVLQALAGLGDLRLYLIRELHRRELDGPEVYNAFPPGDDVLRGKTPASVHDLQQALVTKALKEMLDSLNERPIYKKTISAKGFVQALEVAFRTRISRNQQDAQEFLQLVAERLCDEYHAGVRARRRAIRSSVVVGEGEDGVLEPVVNLTPDGDAERPGITVQGEGGGEDEEVASIIDSKLNDIDKELSFPFEGEMESQIECQFCHFQYKPNPTTFVNLTLQVPQKSSTTLSSCFDGLLKTEYIEDFKCDKCRLQYALEDKLKAKEKAKSASEKERIEIEISKIKETIETDPEQSPEGVLLPDSKMSPKRRIARHMRITTFPKIIAIHLSRSIFDRSSSTKNAAKVSFPERLPLGSILDQKWYKLLGIVCHKGSHNSGHYESFRRNHLYAPFSTPDVFSSYAQSKSASENPSSAPSPMMSATTKRPTDLESSPLNISSVSGTSSPTASTASSSHDSPTSTLPTPRSAPGSSHSSQPAQSQGPTSAPRSSFQSIRSKTSAKLSPSPAQAASDSASTSILPNRNNSKSPTPQNSEEGEKTRFPRRKKKPNERWWRISDEKIKDCKTSDVLGMQKEVYLLFYEMERPGGG
ncbi:ubiquitin-specific protease [Arachnomyces sp. PD_36]|nr:ubiquitin-specific protease [Arachnomyces sp. PD_36]